MMDRLRCAWLLLGLLSICSAGCCCVQGGASCGDCGIGGGFGGALGGACRSGDCGGNCGSGPLAELASCRGGCGEVYVDEWTSHPPTVDNCGYDCGGCGNCGQCRPLKSVFKLLWGRPFVTNCSTGLCGPSCDAGCDSCDGGGTYVDNYGDIHGGEIMGGGSSCRNCTENHIPHEHLEMVPAQPMPDAPAMEVSPNAPSETTPKAIPTPAPDITPSSARRLNPAKQRRNVRRVSATR